MYKYAITEIPINRIPEWEWINSIYAIRTEGLTSKEHKKAVELAVEETIFNNPFTFEKRLTVLSNKTMDLGYIKISVVAFISRSNKDA